MNPYTIVKLNFLVLALFLVLYVMSGVQKGSLERGLNALFGLGQISNSSPASR